MAALRTVREARGLRWCMMLVLQRVIYCRLSGGAFEVPSNDGRGLAGLPAHRPSAVAAAVSTPSGGVANAKRIRPRRRLGQTAGQCDIESCVKSVEFRSFSPQFQTSFSLCNLQQCPDNQAAGSSGVWRGRGLTPGPARFRRCLRSPTGAGRTRRWCRSPSPCTTG